MSQILENFLYLSGEKHALSEKYIKDNNIKYIINCAYEIECRFPQTCSYLVLNMDDDVDENISAHFETCYRFMEQARKSGYGCLVHCAMGISRSATIVLYYLMRRTNKTFDEARAFLKAKREIIDPNDGFEKQLRSIESKLNSRRRRHH